jgi:hypothetical protein
MKLGFERKKTSPWMFNIFEKHNMYHDSTVEQTVEPAIFQQFI